MNLPPRSSRWLNGEARPAAAGGFRFRVLDFEMGTHQAFDEIDFRAADEVEADLVDQKPRAVLFDEDVIFGRGVVEGELVLIARAAAAVDGDAKHHCRSLGGCQGGDALGGAGADADGFFGRRFHW